jgi:enoyl-CoA hydratase/carnithine racemase
MTCPKPLIAAPCGLAVGIGLTMLPHFDLVYAGERTVFSAPFTRLGVCPELGSSFTLTRLLGHQRAGALLLAGESISVDTAREFGLVNEIAPNQEVEALARERAHRLAALPPRAVRATKALLRRWSLATVQEANAAEMDVLVDLAAGPEAAEALAAFAQKRPPDFSRF